MLVIITVFFCLNSSLNLMKYICLAQPVMEISANMATICNIAADWVSYANMAYANMA